MKKKVQQARKSDKVTITVDIGPTLSAYVKKCATQRETTLEAILEAVIADAYLRSKNSTETKQQTREDDIRACTMEFVDAGALARSIAMNMARIQGRMPTSHRAAKTARRLHELATRIEQLTQKGWPVTSRE